MQAIFATEFALNVLAGLVGTFVSAAIIGPVIALVITRHTDRKWRPFRKYIASLLEDNHRDLKRDISHAKEYMQQASRMTPEDVSKLIRQNFDYYRNNIRIEFDRIESIGVRFHFAMTPRLMEKWQTYHIVATHALREIIKDLDTTWYNTAGVVEALQKGTDVFARDPNKFDDVFSVPMRVGSERLASVDMSNLDGQLDKFVKSL